MAEKELRASGVPESEWPGLRYRWSENLTGGMWASVIVEIERRGGNWVVTRLDRRGDELPTDETGFSRL